MTDRLQEIRSRLDAATPGPWVRHGLAITAKRSPRYTFPVCTCDWEDDGDLIAHAPADIAWLLDEVERLRDIQERNMPWWRRDADGSLWAAPPTVDGAPEPDSDKWVRVQ